MKKVKWKYDWGEYMPFCPHCDELAYEYNVCVFCKKPYQWVEPKVKPTIVEKDGIKVIQTTGKGIYICDNDLPAMHMSCTKKKTEEELLALVDFYKRVKAEEVERI